MPSCSTHARMRSPHPGPTWWRNDWWHGGGQNTVRSSSQAQRWQGGDIGLGLGGGGSSTGCVNSEATQRWKSVVLGGDNRGPVVGRQWRQCPAAWGGRERGEAGVNR
jgi:hypothetical protein